MMRSSGSWLRWCLVTFLVVSAICVSGPALYFKFRKALNFTSSCPPCICNCAASLHISPDYPDLKEEMEKQFVNLLSEEISLYKTVGEEHSHHTNITLGEARRLASQYKKEAEKCNAPTETCEGSRERAQALLTKETKVTSLWKQKALKLGWEGE